MIEIPDAEPDGAPAESWYRLPPEGGECPHSGLRLTFFRGLIRERKVKAKWVGGAHHGYYLVERNSVNAFINSLPDRPAAPRQNLRGKGKAEAGEVSREGAEARSEEVEG